MTDPRHRFAPRSGGVMRQPMLSLNPSMARSRAPYRSCLDTTAARAAPAIASAQFRVAVDERGPCHGALPPRDAADADRADAPDDADLRLAERLPDLGAEVGIDDLGVLVDEDQRLQVIERGGLVEDEVVAAKDRVGRPEGEHLRIRLRRVADTRLGVAFVDLRVDDGRAEGDH